MLSFLPAPILFLISSTLLIVNTIFCGGAIVLLAPIKMVMPTEKSRAFLGVIATEFMVFWATFNGLIVRLVAKVDWSVSGLENLSKKHWYLLICNHVSGFDIAVLCYALRKDIPMLKFFLKRQLIRVPFLGWACWALDMPFMMRYTPSQIKKNPKLKGRDFETTRRACEHFRHYPTSVINFVEGSRYTAAKAQQQRSPYQFLLKPKLGGIAFALATLGDQFDKLLNITIIYPDGHDNVLKKVLTGQLTQVKVVIEQLEAPEVDIQQYQNSNEYRVKLQNWLNDLWQSKDRLLGQHLSKH